MSFRLPTRRLIALAASYLVAAQVILLPLSVAAAGPMLNALCVSQPSGLGHGPAGSDSGCGCTAGCGVLCCAPAALNTPPAEFLASPKLVRVLAPVAAFGSGIHSDSRGSHHPRAPPLA